MGVKDFIMKNLNLIQLIIFLLLGLEGYSQAIYTGGEGGGYASLSISSQTFVSTEKQMDQSLKVNVYPNPISQFKEINASSSDFTFGQTVTLSIYDLLGNLVDRREYEIFEKSISLTLPWEKLSKGLYLFVFKVDRKTVTVRVSMS